MRPSEIRKAIVATVAALSTWGVAASADGAISAQERWALLGVVAAAWGTYAVRNAAPADPDATQDLEIPEWLSAPRAAPDFEAGDG